MTAPAIRVEGLWKEYRVGTRATAGDTFYDLLAGLVRRATGRSDEADSGVEGARHFWALRDVGFEIQPGEVVGIIGRNGAGKSTLLKILSRITAPTRGRIEIRGRLASLLEVGTGFHPELTGRENIFLNGAILGMSRREVARKFDEIVAFAEVERFIDTPVKRYSSGMYVRLAFAVAAHLEPDVLLVDEVLAVGDAEFRQRCIRRMQAVAAEGIAVLLVSHSMHDVLAFCPRVIVLERGRKVHDGDTESGVALYQSAALTRRESAQPTLILDVVVSTCADRVPGPEMSLQLKARIAPVASSWRLRAGLYDMRGVLCATIDSPLQAACTRSRQVAVLMKDVPFADGAYSVNVAVLSEAGRVLEVLERARTLCCQWSASWAGPPIWLGAQWAISDSES